MSDRLEVEIGRDGEPVTLDTLIGVLTAMQASLRAVEREVTGKPARLEWRVDFEGVGVSATADLAPILDPLRSENAHLRELLRWARPLAGTEVETSLSPSKEELAKLAEIDEVLNDPA